MKVRWNTSRLALTEPSFHVIYWAYCQGILSQCNHPVLEQEKNVAGSLNKTGTKQDRQWPFLYHRRILNPSVTNLREHHVVMHQSIPAAPIPPPGQLRGICTHCQSRGRALAYPRATPGFCHTRGF